LASDLDNLATWLWSFEFELPLVLADVEIFDAELRLQEVSQITEDGCAHTRAEELSLACLTVLVEFYKLKLGLLVAEGYALLVFFFCVASSHLDLAWLLSDGFGSTLSASRLLLFLDFLVDFLFTGCEFL